MAATPYLAPADLKGDPTLARLTTIDDDALAAYVAEFEALCEDFVGVALTPRDTSDTIAIFTGRTVALRHRPVRTITSVTVDTATVPAAGYVLDANGGRLLLSRAALCAEVIVTYSHGFASPPEAALRACRQYVRATALRDQQAVERDVIAQGFDGGGYTRYSTPDAGDHPTGFLEVDRLLVSLRRTYRPVLVA